MLSFPLSELLSAGRRLIALGEDVSSIRTALKLAGVSLTEDLRPEQQEDVRSQYHIMDHKPAGQKSSLVDGGSRLARGSAADLDSLNQGAGIFEGRSRITQRDSMRLDGSSTKRKRVDSRSDTEHQAEYALRGGGFEKCRSRDQMPPPPIPMQQPFVHTARISFSDMHGPDFQHGLVNSSHFQRPPITPQRHSAQGDLSCSMLAPGSSMKPSNTSWAGAATDDGQSHVDHRQSPRADTGNSVPVYVRGGWQQPPDSFDIERSGNHTSPISSLPSTGQPPERRSMSYHQGSLMFPIDLGGRTIDPSSRSYQSVSSDGSSLYQKRQSGPAMQSELDSPAHARTYHPFPSIEGRITLPRTPSLASRHSSDKGIGLCSLVRRSRYETSYRSANSSSHRQQLVIATPGHQRVASAHFPTRQPAYSSSLPSLGGSNTESFRRINSFDSGPTPVNGEMRHYFSANGENFLLAQDPRVAPNRDRIPILESQASGPRRRANR